MSLHISRRGDELKTTPMVTAEEVPGIPARVIGITPVRADNHGAAMVVTAGSKIPTIGALTIRAEAKARVTGRGQTATTGVVKVLTRLPTRVKELRRSK